MVSYRHFTVFATTISASTNLIKPACARVLPSQINPAFFLMPPPTPSPGDTAPLEPTGQPLISALVENWRGIRQNSIVLARRAEVAENAVCDVVEPFQTAHDSYAALQRELDGVPALTEQISRISSSVAGVIDKVTRLEIALDLAIKQHNESIIHAARINADDALLQERGRLHTEFVETRREVTVARQRRVDAALRAHKAQVQAQVENAMAQYALRATAAAAEETATTGSITASSAAVAVPGILR